MGPGRVAAAEQLGVGTGRPAWTRVREPDGNPGQVPAPFDTEQPDLNWGQPGNPDDFGENTALLAGPRRGWLRTTWRTAWAASPGPTTDLGIEVLHHRDDDPRFNHPNTRSPRHLSVIDEYPGAVNRRRGVGTRQRPLGGVSAAWTNCISVTGLARTEFDAAEIRDAVANSGRRGGCRTRPQPGRGQSRCGRRLAATVAAIGLRRAKAMAVVMLALPGVVFM